MALPNPDEQYRGLSGVQWLWFSTPPGWTSLAAHALGLGELQDGPIALSGPVVTTPKWPKVKSLSVSPGLGQVQAPSCHLFEVK
jgi:hypothetical protein